MAILRRIKEKLKKITRRKLPEAKAKKAKGPVRAETKKDIPGAQEVLVEQAKFSHPERGRMLRGMPQELPSSYGRDKLVLQVRDPWWIHAYWELGSVTIGRFKGELGEEFFKSRRVLRVYDVSNIIFNGANAHKFFDIHIDEHATSWYIDTQGPGRSWCVDYGLLLPDGRFITILRSNIVYTPLEGPSWINDEEWMIPEEMFARLYGMGFGLGRSSPVGKAWQERVRGVLSSPGVSSVASPVKKGLKRKFWMAVDCELIVYGSTEPDAKVTVQGKPVALRPDGTFTLRFSLPNGKQVIPVRGVSADNLEERVITPIVTRETK